jgi:hypothetical protein
MDEHAEFGLPVPRGALRLSVCAGVLGLADKGKSKQKNARSQAKEKTPPSDCEIGHAFAPYDSGLLFDLHNSPPKPAREGGNS